MFIPLLPRSAFPFTWDSQVTRNLSAAKACVARFRTLSTEPRTAMSG